MDIVEHYGIKGMKWGVKKADAPPEHNDARGKREVKEAVKKGKVKSVSSADLRKAIDRMQLEQNYKRLAVNEQSPIVRFIQSTLLEIGKREVQTQLAKKAGALVARKLATGGAA